MRMIMLENFFANFGQLEQAFMDIPRYNYKDHPEVQVAGLSKTDGTELNFKWPGERSDDLKTVAPFATSLFLKEFIKFGNFIPPNLPFKIYTHLRLDEDNKEEFVHKDSPSADYSTLVYLSRTNLNSGTKLYNDNEEEVADIKFVQNRAVMFDSRYNHKPINNHGKSISDGRLTLNIFWREMGSGPILRKDTNR